MSEFSKEQRPEDVDAFKNEVFVTINEIRASPKSFRDKLQELQDAVYVAERGVLI